jgi:phthiocerol/phenolphthiocerol synthesis type-I polyketide synthase E
MACYVQQVTGHDSGVFRVVPSPGQSVMKESATDVTTHSGGDTTQRLAHIWQELLGVKSIGLGENYFDLGGDSPLAVQLFAQIDKEFKIRLPLATLFEAPTIEELARVLQRETPTSHWSSVVPIQPIGSRPPLFCVHGAGGNVLIYRDLSRHLGSDQPFFGLQARGLDGSRPPLTRVEEMAALYVREMRRVQPSGPYFLGGYCLGGTIAFEMAQQLQSRGEEVALLALFDTLNWYKVPLPSIWGKGYHQAERLVFHAANFLGLDFAGKVMFFLEKLKVLRSRVPVWRGMLLAKFAKDSPSGKSRSRLLGDIWQANDRAGFDYAPQPYQGVITDFRPIKQYRMGSKPGLKWDRLAQGGQEIVLLPVYPAGMLLEPFVNHLATALRRSIDAAIRRIEVGHGVPKGSRSASNSGMT